MKEMGKYLLESKHKINGRLWVYDWNAMNWYIEGKGLVSHAGEYCEKIISRDVGEGRSRGD